MISSTLETKNRYTGPRQRALIQLARLAEQCLIFPVGIVLSVMPVKRATSVPLATATTGARVNSFYLLLALLWLVLVSSDSATPLIIRGCFSLKRL